MSIDKLVERIKEYGITVSGFEWRHKDLTFKSNKLYTMVSKVSKVEYGNGITNKSSEVVLKHLSSLDIGHNLLQEYIGRARSFELPINAKILEDVSGELNLRYDDRADTNYNWYSRSRENLMEIAYEIELKRLVKGE